MLSLAGCSRHSESSAVYEFRSGSDGRMIYRCNRITGEVHYFRYPSETVVWTKVAEPTSIPMTKVAEPTRDIFDKVAKELSNEK